jgi:hypothetical protein
MTYYDYGMTYGIYGLTYGGYGMTYRRYGRLARVSSRRMSDVCTEENHWFSE